MTFYLKGRSLVPSPTYRCSQVRQRAKIECSRQPSSPLPEVLLGAQGSSCWWAQVQTEAITSKESQLGCIDLRTLEISSALFLIFTFQSSCKRFDIFMTYIVFKHSQEITYQIFINIFYSFKNY